jgi:uncharacterized protein (TIGR03086 family)
MSEIADRYRVVARGFTERATAVPPAAWDQPSPCEGWVARDIVRHLVEWLPAFLRAGASIDLPGGPPVDDDPIAAWIAMSDGVQAVLDDPATSRREFAHEQAGRHAVDAAIEQFFLPDVLVHTWDLARAAGLDETLERAEVHRLVAGFDVIDPALDSAMRASGQFGARVAVAHDADEQTRLLAFMGRRP